MQIPRPEHPRPQFQRDNWLNLNGVWTYTFDFGLSGLDPGRDLYTSQGFADEIVVPFCPESQLSGVAHTDFIPCLWYHRRLQVPSAWRGKRVILHFGGVDYQSEIFIDGKSVAEHFGGSVGFSVDITDAVTANVDHHLVIRVIDALRDGNQPGGKQCPSYRSRGCHYTRTTGIWQTVWLEAVPPTGLTAVHIVPDLDRGSFTLTPHFQATAKGQQFVVQAVSEGAVVAEASGAAAAGIPVMIALPAPRAWSPADPYLYELVLQVRDDDGQIIDEVQSYAGLRKIMIDGDQVLLNNEPIFQRLVLDQGFYPDGIWTAPSDAALKRDIELSLAAGFNGARLHQKVFEERFHYWADRLGYLTWGESASWGLDVSHPLSARAFLSEWQAIICRDRNHPSIIAWTPFNETRGMHDPRQHHRLHRDAAALTRALDPTRPVNDASGYVHVDTDLWTVHNYEQDPATLLAVLTSVADGVWRNFPDLEADYAGQPYLIDEFGGIKWIPPERRPNADDAWGYGQAPADLTAFYERLEGMIAALLSLPNLRGYCYTQLTDVEQEQNGIYNYDRTPKFEMSRIAAAFGRTPERPVS